MANITAGAIPWEDNFRQHVKLRRELLELTQTDLAKQMKRKGFAFHQQTIQRIENGDRPIRLDEAFMLAEILQSRISTMTSPPDAGLGSLVYAIDRLRHESAQMSEGLHELFAEDWFERFDELHGAFQEVFEQYSHESTPEVRVAAAWVIKAVWAFDALNDLLVFLNGISSESGVWREDVLTKDIPSSLQWLEDDEADLWRLLDPTERPSYLADMDPDELSRFIDQAFIQKLRGGDSGEHPEAP